MYCFCDIVWHCPGKFHFAVYNHTSVPEVENFQVLKTGKVGLKVWK